MICFVHQGVEETRKKRRVFPKRLPQILDGYADILCLLHGKAPLTPRPGLLGVNADPARDKK